MAALARGDDRFQTGRYLVTFKEGAGQSGLRYLEAMRVAHAGDFEGQAVTLDQLSDADALFLPEINMALIGGQAASEHKLGEQAEIASDSPIASIEPEYFVFADGGTSGSVVESGFVELAKSTTFESLPGFTESLYQASNSYLRGFLQATETIAREIRKTGNGHSHQEIEEETEALLATWGLKACKVPTSRRSGAGINIAVLANGFDSGHPDFVGRSIVSQTFVGEPVMDLNGHGTHMIGTACGPLSPADPTPRYGIGYQTSIYVAKVLTNSMMGTVASVLTGINWAIANRCPVIFAPLAMAGGPSAVFTAAGKAALNKGCLLIAGSSSAGASVGAPANSPTILSVAALNQNLQPTPFSPVGKIDMAAPGVDTFSSWPRPRRYATISGIASATAHVAGCAALWAETSPALRGIRLWQKLQNTARGLPFPATRVGAGLVQAP
ncbi:peptidase S8 [Spirosoma radiotolerans]|uniref:Peptidase S8 n=1 Tax=Spirosoma radiotolerans TaxID=1379870 RepID=A0A0E3ZZT6_9BACT|nr:peptidase S8 [Spirosoma radiotolerans]